MTAMPEHPPLSTGPRSESLHDADDAELAERSRFDAEAFGVLYERYSRQIYRMIYHRLGDPADAEDLTAEVFVKALKAIHGYRPSRAPFWGWLHRIARNAVIDHYRARRPAASLSAVADAADSAANVEAQVVLRAEATQAWRAVAQLCPTQRTAVTLRLAHDLPIAAIAGHMERSEGAVKQLLNRGLTAVRERLADECLFATTESAGRHSERRGAPDSGEVLNAGATPS